MWLFDLVIANMELFVFSEVSRTCGTGIKFPHKPTSLFWSDLNKLLPAPGPKILLLVPSFLSKPKLGDLQDGILPCLVCGKILNQQFSAPEK